MFNSRYFHTLTWFSELVKSRTKRLWLHKASIHVYPVSRGTWSVSARFVPPRGSGFRPPRGSSFGPPFARRKEKVWTGLETTDNLRDSFWLAIMWLDEEAPE